MMSQQSLVPRTSSSLLAAVMTATALLIVLPLTQASSMSRECSNKWAIDDLDAWIRENRGDATTAWPDELLDSPEVAAMKQEVPTNAYVYHCTITMDGVQFGEYAICESKNNAPTGCVSMATYGGQVCDAAEFCGAATSSSSSVSSPDDDYTRFRVDCSNLNGPKSDCDEYPFETGPGSGGNPGSSAGSDGNSDVIEEDDVDNEEETGNNDVVAEEDGSASQRPGGNSAGSSGGEGSGGSGDIPNDGGGEEATSSTGDSGEEDADSGGSDGGNGNGNDGDSNGNGDGDGDGDENSLSSSRCSSSYASVLTFTSLLALVLSSL